MIRPNRKLRRAITKHIAEVAKSITTFGMVAPVLIDSHNNVIDGLVRLAAAARPKRMRYILERNAS